MYKNDMKILKSITCTTLLFFAIGLTAQTNKDQKVIKDADKAYHADMAYLTACKEAGIDVDSSKLFSGTDYL